MDTTKLALKCHFLLHRAISLAHWFALSVSQWLGLSSVTSFDQNQYICGIGTAWPSSVLTADGFEDWIRRRHGDLSPSLERLLRINKKTGIRKRHVVASSDPRWNEAEKPPSVDEIEAVFREHGTALAVSACSKAIKEWGGRVRDITHTVAVTCTSSGSPGYDLEVVKQLQLSPHVERTLLHGVGCAGGLSALRMASRLAQASGSKPANILVFSCEIPSIHNFPELYRDSSIGPVLFGDGAGAFLLSNNVRSARMPIYRLFSSTSTRVPDTEDLMSYYNSQIGYKLTLSRQVPEQVARAMMPAYSSVRQTLGRAPCDFDWALHPGGLGVLKGAEFAMGLTQSNLRASYDVYREYGNCSSATIFAVFDRLRELDSTRDNIIAMSFGPGLLVETAALGRCRNVL